MKTHLASVQRSWTLLTNLLESPDGVILDGSNDSLNLVHVVAVSRYEPSFRRRQLNF